MGGTAGKSFFTSKKSDQCMREGAREAADTATGNNQGLQKGEEVAAALKAHGRGEGIGSSNRFESFAETFRCYFIGYMES